MVRQQYEQGEYIEFINNHLGNDGYKFNLADNISGFPVYHIDKVLDGVKGSVKNLIFAAVNQKPEIVISDSINNDIRIVKHEENCLVYDRTLTNTGLYWADLVSWWADMHGVSEQNLETEKQIYVRLLQTVASPPEMLLFKSYFKSFKEFFDKNFKCCGTRTYSH
ncbi:MAG: hypothetical protein ACQEXV_07710 [Bacillota bacterium]